MKIILFSILSLVSAGAFAVDTANSCIWEGEEHLKDAVIGNKIHWLEAAYTVHKNGGDQPIAFEGVGSCRFVKRDLGLTADAVVANYIKNPLTIVPTRAYVKIEGGATKFVIPSAVYSKSTNYLFIKKDFYNLSDKNMCSKQMDDMITLGQAAQDLDLADLEIKGNEYEGITAVINANSPEATYLGVCSFHSIED